MRFGELVVQLEGPADSLAGQLERFIGIDRFVVRKRHEDRLGEPVNLSRGPITLKDGELIGFQVKNIGRAAVDVTLLFVDSGYGITPFFPRPGTVSDNRIPPGDSITRKAKVDAATVGLEQMLIIAMKAQGPPVDFNWLAQPTLQRARSTAAVRGDQSPLGQLLEFVSYRAGGMRGLTAQEDAACSIQMLSWNVVPK